MAKTYMLVIYDDVADASVVRYVQGAKFGDADTDLTAKDKGDVKKVAKDLSDKIKIKPSVTPKVSATITSRPPSIPLVSQWTWDKVVLPVKNLYRKIFGE